MCFGISVESAIGNMNPPRFYREEDFLLPHNGTFGVFDMLWRLMLHVLCLVSIFIPETNPQTLS